LSGKVDTDGQQQTSTLATAAELLLVASIMITALAFGRFRARTVGIFEVVTAIATTLWVANLLIGKRLHITITSTALPIVALVLYGLLQTVKLRSGLGVTESLSRDVQATRTVVTLLFFLLLAFMIASNSFANRQRLSGLANSLIVYGLAVAAVAVIYGYLTSGEGQGLPAAFPNRNHFAGHMELLVTLPIALLVGDRASRKKQAFYILAASAMGVAVVGSLSRGGMIGLGASLAFIVVLSSRFPERVRRNTITPWASRSRVPIFRSHFTAVLAVGAAILTGLVLIGARPALHRVAETVREMKGADREDFTDGRKRIWNNTLGIIHANPVFGVGLGAFPIVYETYNDASAVGRAHNDYLQLLAEGGVVGGALALWFLIALSRTISRGLRSSDPMLARLALGSAAGIFAILVHSLFDYNLQVLPNVLLFLLLLALTSRIAEFDAKTITSARLP